MRSSALTLKRPLDRRRFALSLAGVPLLGAVGLTSASEESSTPPSDNPTTSEVFDSKVPLGRTLENKPLTIGDLPGRVLIVCFWASWCPHCRSAIPVLEKIQASVSSDHLRVVLVNTEPASDWRRLRRPLEGKLNGLLTHDTEGSVRKAFTAPQGIPHTVLVGRDGRRHATLAGWSTKSTDWLVERTNRALAETVR